MFSTNHQVKPSPQWVVVNGRPTYLHGCNYPWTRGHAGRSNYGLDFGVDLRGSHGGVSTRRDEVRQDFFEMQALGLNVVRWFVFCDGRGGVKFDNDLMPAGVSPKFYEDMDCALRIAEETGIAIVFVLFDYLWLFDRIHDSRGRDTLLRGHARIFRTEKGQDALLENLCLPLYEHYGSSPQVLAWEVMNEPDFVISELDCARKAKRSAMTLSQFERCVRLIAAAAHAQTAQKVTIGGGRVKNVRLWDEGRWELDFLQVHSYNDYLHAPWDDVLFGTRVETLKLDKPLVIGEFPADRDSFRSLAESLSPATASLPVPTLEEYLDFALDCGYAGAWGWSLNGVDACGAPDRTVLRDWSARRAAAMRLPQMPPLA